MSNLESLRNDPLTWAVVSNAIAKYRRQAPMREEFLALLPPDFDGNLDHEFAKFYLEIEKLSRTEISRVGICDYAMAIAFVVALRSEDPKRKVGAVGLNRDNRIIATAYNGLPPGQNRDALWWASDYNRRTYVVHAEANLCSLTERGHVITVAVTTMPCGPCALNLVAHGVKKVIYCYEYGTDPVGEEILQANDVELLKIPRSNVTSIFNHM